MSYNIVVGVLAYNEVDAIGDLLTSLKKQTLFSAEKIYLSIIVIANGCSDDTAQVCREFFSEWGACIGKSNRIVFNVSEVEMGDKANAWNILIHEYCKAEDDFVILLDGDIKICERTNLEQLIGLLRVNPDMDVVTSMPLKVLPDDLPGWFIRLSKAGSKNNEHTRHTIAGSLYAARLETLRKIWLPVGLPVEDGFIRAMILTRSFSEAENVGRVDRCVGCTHEYQGDDSVSGIINHQVRLLAGSFLNSILFKYIQSIKATPGNATVVLHQQIVEDPHLIMGLLDKHILSSGWLIIPGHFYFERIKRLKYYQGIDKIKKLPIIILGLSFDLLCSFKARKLIMNKQVLGFW